MHRTTPQADARTRIPDAALKIIREKGHAATRVDGICAEAGLTKGGFFLAKARGGPEIAREMIDHLDRYIRLLFGRTG